MYIISKKENKDYYDGVAGTVGIDKTVVYERHSVEFNTREQKDVPKIFHTKKWSDWKNPIHMLSHIRSTSNKYDYSYFLIGFCGKLYIGFKIIEKGGQGYVNGVICDIPDNVYITYSLNEFLEKYSENQKKEINSDFQNFYENIIKINALEINQEYKTPIWIYEKERFIINGKLSSFDFYKIVDSFTAFQEISMFIGGVLGVGEKKIIEVSDKHKIEQHGFDYKWSFRKEKENK